MDTLVLSQGFEAVATVSWQRAVSLFFQGKVEIIEEYEDKDLHSMTFTIKMPSVVRFLQAVRGRKRSVKFSRESVLARDKGACCYCARKLTRSEATYDHVIPRSQGGKTTWDNVVIACIPCNQAKGGRTPEQAKMHLRTRPVRPKVLPNMRVTVLWAPGMHQSWRSWVTDAIYWQGALDSDEV